MQETKTIFAGRSRPVTEVIRRGIREDMPSALGESPGRAKGVA